MKRTISILVLVAMMLASVLAILPAAAEEGAGDVTATRKNVLYSSPNAADTHFAGEGNSFYYDYHYYVDKVNTFPIENKGPSLRHGVNSGSGSASITDGAKFSGNMNHQFNSTGATIALDDGTEATHSHIFGLSFKESITVDGFKLWAASGVDGFADVTKITVYGATVDPAKAVDAPDYTSGYYYYGAPTLLYAMEDGENLQDYIEFEGESKAAVIGADFDVVTIDYLLIGVDFAEGVTGGKYKVYEVEAYEASLVKDYETAVLGDVLYSFNFKGDDVFKPENQRENYMDYVVSADGNEVTIKAKEGAEDKQCNMWGGEVLGLEATLDRVYSFRYKARANSEGYDAGTAKNNSLGVGGWLVKDGYTYNSSVPVYNNYSNHTTIATDGDISMRRSSISFGNTKYGDDNLTPGNNYPDYIYWNSEESTLPGEYAVDMDGFVDVLLVFDGPAGTISSYILDTTGSWMFMESVEELKHEGNMGFYTYAYYNAVNTTVKDVKIYKGDFTKYIPPEVEEATEDELATLKSYIDAASALVEANYTAESWSKLVRALDRAKEIYGADIKPKADVASRTTVLVNIMAALEADMSTINELINACRKLKEADYTKESWAPFKEALDAARANEASDYETVQGLVDALNAAKDALVAAPADKTELGEYLVLAALLVEADYAEDDWAEYTEKVAAAQAIFDKEDATPTEVKDAAKALKKAIEAINGGVLPDPIDYAALEGAIAEAEAFVEADYTAESWATFATALEAAKAALEAETQVEVDAAVADLAAAVAALVEASVEQPTEEPTEEPTEAPTAEATEKPTDKATEKPTEAPKATEAPTDAPAEKSGCGSVIGMSAVVLTAVLGLGAVVLKKKD